MTTRKNLSKLERVPLREAWKHEASDFTPWLAEAENLNELSDALGLSELILVATEDESRWNEYLDWLTQRVVKMDQVLRPIVKTLP